MRKLYKEKRQKIVDHVSKLKNLRHLGSEAGLHMLIEYIGNTDEKKLLLRLKKEGFTIQSIKELCISTSYDRPRFILRFGAVDIEHIIKGIHLFKRIIL